MLLAGNIMQYHFQAQPLKVRNTLYEQKIYYEKYKTLSSFLKNDIKKALEKGH